MKLKKIVQRGIGGGWKFISEIGHWKIKDTYYNGLVLEISDLHLITLSLPDLLASKPFMTAAYGEELKVIREIYCERVCNTRVKKLLNSCKICNNTLPAHRYHMHKAMDIIYDGGDAIKYLYENMP